MTNRKIEFETIINDSIQISIIKIRVYEVSLQFLNEKELADRNTNTILAEKINKVPIKEFKRILAVMDDKESYDKRIRRVVWSIVKQYLSFLRIEKRKK